MLAEAVTLKVRISEMEKMMALMAQKLKEHGTNYGVQGPWDLPAAFWATSERYSKHHTYKSW